MAEHILTIAFALVLNYEIMHIIGFLRTLFIYIYIYIYIYMLNTHTK